MYRSASSSSASTARIPPKRAFDRATSSSERRTIRASMAGSSRYSMPRRRRGVSRPARLSLQLCVSPAVVEQGALRVGGGGDDLADVDGVVAGAMTVHEVALDVRQRAVEQRRA